MAPSKKNKRSSCSQDSRQSESHSQSKRFHSSSIAVNNLPVPSNTTLPPDPNTSTTSSTFPLIHDSAVPTSEMEQSVSIFNARLNVLTSRKSSASQSSFSHPVILAAVEAVAANPNTFNVMKDIAKKELTTSFPAFLSNPTLLQKLGNCLNF